MLMNAAHKKGPPPEEGPGNSHVRSNAVIEFQQPGFGFCSLQPNSADELRCRAASVPLARFNATDLRRRDLAEPALERRFLAFDGNSDGNVKAMR
jgi:hypothetical protein